MVEMVGVRFPYEMIFKKGLNIPTKINIYTDEEHPVETPTDVLRNIFINCGKSIFDVCIFEHASGSISVEVSMRGITQLRIKNAKYRQVKSDREKEMLKIENNENYLYYTDEDRTKRYG